MDQRIPDRSWQEHRTEIEALYMEDNQTLEEVMAAMKERHAFVARFGTLSYNLYFTDTF